MVREYARERGVPFVLVACAAPVEKLRQRVVQRELEGFDASEAGLGVLERQAEKLEPLLAEELDTAVIVDAPDVAEAKRLAAHSVAARLQPD
jgi:hypothetical protein